MPEKSRDEMAFEIAKVLLPHAIVKVKLPWWVRCYCFVTGQHCPVNVLYNGDAIAKTAYEFVDQLDTASLQSKR